MFFVIFVSLKLLFDSLKQFKITPEMHMFDIKQTRDMGPVNESMALVYCKVHLHWILIYRLALLLTLCRSLTHI